MSDATPALGRRALGMAGLWTVRAVAFGAIFYSPNDILVPGLLLTGFILAEAFSIRLLRRQRLASATAAICGAHIGWMVFRLASTTDQTGSTIQIGQIFEIGLFSSIAVWLYLRRTLIPYIALGLYEAVALSINLVDLIQAPFESDASKIIAIHVAFRYGVIISAISEWMRARRDDRAAAKSAGGTM
jgi:hypothetical protein